MATVRIQPKHQFDGGVLIPASAASGKVLVSDASGNATWQSASSTLVLDTTATDIAMNGTQAAGATGKAADAGHVHPSDTSRVASASTGAQMTRPSKRAPSANITITTGSGAWQTLAMNTIVFDDDGLSITNGFKALTAGYYLVMAKLYLQNNTPSASALYVGTSLNGGTPEANQYEASVPVSGVWDKGYCANYKLAANDTLIPQFFATISGSGWLFVGGGAGQNWNSWFSVQRVA